jgi:hypothetical protein
MTKRSSDTVANAEGELEFENYLDNKADHTHPVNYKAFSDLLPELFFPRERDYDEKNDPRISKLSVPAKLEYAKAIAGLDEYTSRFQRKEDPTIPIIVDEEHSHTRVLIPPQCKFLCIKMGDDQIRRFAWKRPPGSENEDLPSVSVPMRSRDAEDVDEEYASYVDHIISHFWVKRRGELTLNTFSRYNWFQSFIHNRRALARQGQPFEITLVKFVKMMESGARIWCRGIQCNFARGFLFAILAMDSRCAFYACVLFLLTDLGTVPDELFTHTAVVPIDRLEHPENAEKITLRYASHVFFTCDCPQIVSRLT